MRARSLAVISIALMIFGCSGTIEDPAGDGTSSSGVPGSGADSGAPSSTHDDSGAPSPGDSGAIVDDSGTPTSADTQAPPPVDSGSTPPPIDSGTTPPPPADTGTTPPPPVDSGPPPTDPIEASRVLCVSEINRYRATLGLKALVGWTSANACVDGESKADSISGVAHSAFGKCGEFAQNECPGWAGPTDSLILGCLKMMWAEGPGTPYEAHGHYINMSNTSYTMVSCGFYKTPSGNYWAAQDFK